MDNTQILSLYEEGSRLTRHMLLAAREGDWDRLVAHEQDCAAMFAHLSASNDRQPGEADFQQRKAELIRGMLEDDAQIRLLVEPWLARLSGLIGSTRQQSRLHQAYANSGASGATP